MPAPPDQPQLAALVRISHLVRHALAQAGQDQGLTSRQVDLLLLLHGDGPTGMAELRWALRAGKSGFSELIDRAERKDLVTRTGAPADRRACQIELTEAGSRLAALSQQNVATRLEALTDMLCPADKRCVASLIAQLIAADDEPPTSD
ncbi:MarR family winged helix-turn-helix transcriptional regulator [Actinomadura sp. B10D3]|uniref:MarR family winged helix-turn-helix transcriptional regulator n=1 Tax=Actinomadura sp. B10D3 TaxID=3153557 RepID=UPI00325D9B5D